MGSSKNEVPKGFDPAKFHRPIAAGVNGSYTSDSHGYALSGKIMVSAILVLFAVLVFILCLHVYARCYLLRRRRSEMLRRRSRARAQFVFASEVPSAVTVRGLDAAVLRSLPVFVYSTKTHQEPLECAVCLCEFEENEKGRRLPKCNHSFHTDCIDMWFHSHSTCPLCRAAINLETSDETVIAVEMDSSSGLCETCRHDEGTASSSSSCLPPVAEQGSSSTDSSSVSSASGKKLTGFLGIRVEVPTRNASFRNLETDTISISPGGQELKSPGSRILALKRILSRELGMSPTALSCRSVPEVDLERGEEQGPSFHS